MTLHGHDAGTRGTRSLFSRSPASRDEIVFRAASVSWKHRRELKLFLTALVLIISQIAKKTRVNVIFIVVIPGFIFVFYHKSFAAHEFCTHLYTIANIILCY